VHPKQSGSRRGRVGNKAKGDLKVAVAVPAALLIALALFATSLGAVSVPLIDIAPMILNKTGLFHFPRHWSEGDEMILLAVRMPRVVSGALVGASLSVAGVVFQALLRNPMADPYIIGTSGGAAFGATVAMFLPLQVMWAGYGVVPVFAFAGAMLTVLFVYSLGRVGTRVSVVSMLLSGFAVSSTLTAFMSFLMLVSGRFRQVFVWLMGGLAAGGWDQIVVLVVPTCATILVLYMLAGRMNALVLGEEQASYLGVNVERQKLILLMLGSLLTALAVSISGLVGFVGLVAPHVARLIFGPNHRLLLPAAMFLGSSFLVLSDLIARTLLAPTEIPLGIVTAIVGAPFFVYLLRKSKKEYAF